MIFLRSLRLLFATFAVKGFLSIKISDGEAFDGMRT
jgi:hypothetical protein